MGRRKPAEIMVPKSYRIFPSIRFFMLILVTIGGSFLAIAAGSMGFGLVCMVNSTILHSQNFSGPTNRNSSIYNSCSEKQHSIVDSYSGTFFWSKAEQANMLAAYSWGGIWVQLFAGWFLDHYGPKMVFAFINSVSAITLLLLPIIAVSLDHWGVFVIRFIGGMLGSSQIATAMTFVSLWIPPQESGTFIAIAMLGFPLGNLALMVTSGVLCASPLGWQGIFYIYGGVMVAWVVVWLVLFENNPADTRFISKEEVAYITHYRHHVHRSKDSSSQKQKKIVPWRKILTSPAVWAGVSAQFSFGWMIFFIPYYLPSYMAQVLLLGVEKNGFLSAIPYIAQTLGRLVVGPVSDLIGNRISHTANVKIWTTICNCGPAIFCVALGFLNCNDEALAVIFFSLIQFSTAASVGGFLKSYVFIAPRFSGAVASIGQTLAFIAASIMSYSIGLLTGDGTVEEWRRALLVSGAVSCAGGIIFLIFGSGNEQPWAAKPPEKNKNSEPLNIGPIERSSSKKAKF